jgi:hypothetical protein
MEYIKDLYSPEIDHAICKNMLYLKMETHFVYDIIITINHSKSKIQND